MVNRWRSAILVLAVALPGYARAAEGPGGIVEEFWEAAHIDGVKVGFAHTTVQERNSPGGKRLRCCCELDLSFRRQGSLMRLHVEQGSEETSEGRVVGVFMRQGHAGVGPRLELAGEWEDGKMHVRVDGGRIERRLPWPTGVIGWYGREHFFQKSNVHPGDRFTFLHYEPTFNCVLTIRAQVRAAERTVPDLRGKAVLCVNMTADRIEVPGHSIQPPSAVWWLDDAGLPVRKEFDLEGLGTVVLTRVSKEQAQAPAQPGRSVDLGLKSLVLLDRVIPRPYDSRSAVYRITVAGDPEPGKALADDAHQQVRALLGETFELHVHPPQFAEVRPDARPAPGEYLAPCRYIDCNDPRVQAQARRAVGDETDPWAKARRIERWVKQVLRVDQAAPFAPAGQIAADLRGDCRHFALLTAALCRAERVPARTAVGLLYVEKGGRPYLGFHMWTEVWVAGQWLGLDATLGRGGVSAAHLKIADASWHDAESLTPLLPVGRILGKVRVEVLRVEGAP
jgi:hypothetical protein